MKKILALLSICGCCYGQTTLQPTTRVLTFEETLRLALKNAMLINQQKNNLELNQMQKLSNVMGLGPTANASVGAQRVDGNNFNQQQGKVVNGIFDQISGQVNVNQTVFNGFAQVYRARQYDNLLDAQAFYVNRTQQDIINTVTGQFLTVLLDRELLRIANENW